MPFTLEMASETQITVATAIFGGLVIQKFHLEVIDGVGVTGSRVVDLVSGKACQGEPSNEHVRSHDKRVKNEWGQKDQECFERKRATK